MSCEDIDNLTFSHEKLSELLDNVSDINERDKIVKDFIKSNKSTAIVDFPKGLEWFNVKEPLSFNRQLKGKLVLLDFFTYCCINCMHVLPDLKELEEDFPVESGFVVIGVHSAKFDNEKISSNILSAVQRYNISHPVVNDTDTFMWNNCGINCWPTLLLLGPNGNPLVMLMGEGHKDDLHLYIRNALEYYKSRNEILNHPLPLQSSFYLLPELKGPLLFPGKITSYVDVDNNNIEYFAISDTGNHRILIISSEGTVLQQIGSICGFKNGNFSEARFNSPQGLVFQNEHILYVADTENHAIRKIDLKHRFVETVAGTGNQGIDRMGGKIGIQQEISSPWDLCIYKTPDMDMSFHLPNEKVIEKEVLIIAMAGTHQIWALFLDDIVWWKFKRYTKGTCIYIAGSGKEENRNNSYPHAAAFAQPSGLALCKDKKEIYVADSESSSIRRLSLIDGKVSAVVGGDKSPTNLFGFGDTDGKLYEAKLQHPIGLAMFQSPSVQYLFVADTYNHKIKYVNISSNTVKTLHFSNDQNPNNDYTFNEPCGMCFNKDGNKLYVCDTNNHSIKLVHFNDDKMTNIIKVTKLDLRVSDKQESLAIKNKFKTIIPIGKMFHINASGGKIILRVNCNFINGYNLTIDAPQKWLVLLPNEIWSCVPLNGYNIDSFDSIISVPNPENIQATQKFYIEFNFAVCKNNMCLPKNFALEFCIKFSEKGVGQIDESIYLNVASDVVISNKL